MVPQRAFQTGNRTSKKLNGVVHSLPETQSRRGLWFPNCVLMHPGPQQGNAVSVIDPVNTNSRYCILLTLDYCMPFDDISL